VPILPDGPKIIFIPPNVVFGAENVGFEIPSSPYMAYSGGSAAQAAGQSSFIGQITTERDIQPFNACSNAIGPVKTRNPINFAG
jgi:hypothetical protein